MLNELGAEAYEEALADHRRLLREAFARHVREETASRDDDPVERRVRHETEAELRGRLGEDAYAAAYAEGRALALEDALALALRPD